MLIKSFSFNKLNCFLLVIGTLKQDEINNVRKSMNTILFMKVELKIDTIRF
tara:strand:- start:1 stop:153 length:153 start_codon:yes stop_codon:yes gene_type:complete